MNFRQIIYFVLMLMITTLYMAGGNPTPLRSPLLIIWQLLCQKKLNVVQFLKFIMEYPNNIEAHRINFQLINNSKGVFDQSYNDRKIGWTSSSLQQSLESNRIELLTIHSYDPLIAERRQDRSMNETRIVQLRQKNLHSLDDYVDVLLSISRIESISRYLVNNIIPVSADWPGQLFIRKAITKIRNQSSNNNIIRNFIPLIGPLHVSLNSREQVVLIHWKFFNKMYRSLFGKKKVLAEKPKPWRINFLLDLSNRGWKKISHVILNKFPRNCKDIEYRIMIDLLDNLIPSTLDIYAVLFRSGSFNEYLETLFRIWTFALKWKRKNYNKAPLAFLSDYFYWKENSHPFSESIEKYLVNFNVYYVENIHSQIRANTTSLDSADTIVNEAYVLDLHDQTKINSFKNYHKYPYTEPVLNELTNRISIFLLDHFRLIYLNLEKNKDRQPKKNFKTYKLEALNETVDIRSFPTGHPFHQCLVCDKCKQELGNLNVSVLICGHGYHYECYQSWRDVCKYCEEYYKKGIFKNVDSFLERLNEGEDILTSEDVEEESCEEDREEDVAIPEINLDMDLNRRIELVNEW